MICCMLCQLLYVLKLGSNQQSEPRGFFLHKPGFSHYIDISSISLSNSLLSLLASVLLVFIRLNFATPPIYVKILYMPRGSCCNCIVACCVASGFDIYTLSA